MINSGLIICIDPVKNFIFVHHRDIVSQHFLHFPV